jgi:hypothetical protein
LDGVADRGLDIGRQRVSIREAARLLDVSESAIHKRVQRGTIPHDKGEDGRVFVYLDAPGNSVTDKVSDTVQHPSTEALISEMRDRIESLEHQLEEAHEANRENRRIIAGLIQRVPELESPRDEPHGPETDAEGEAGTSAPPDRETGAQRRERSWWRRFFGFE